jgi:hypothetical protein
MATILSPTVQFYPEVRPERPFSDWRSHASELSPEFDATEWAAIDNGLAARVALEMEVMHKKSDYAPFPTFKQQESTSQID